MASFGDGYYHIVRLSPRIESTDWCFTYQAWNLGLLLAQQSSVLDAEGYRSSTWPFTTKGDYPLGHQGCSKDILSETAWSCRTNP